MFADLASALECDAAQAAGGLTLIKCAAPTGEGALLLHHYISLHLQARRPVCLCGFEQVGASVAAEGRQGRARACLRLAAEPYV